MTNIHTSTRAIKEKEIQRSWHVIDLKGKILGRELTKVSTFLQGKHKVDYVPYLDMGDHVVIINAKHLKVTGKKENNKVYKYYSGFPGGLNEVSFKDMMVRRPEEIVRHAVSGMLPKNKHRDVRLSRLHIYSEEEHPFEEKLKVNES